jgi:hypothetical protein
VTYARYTGHETLAFPDYLDLSAGRTLTAEPGRSYDVAPASGRTVPDIPAGWFTPAEGQERSEEESAPDEAPEPEPAAEHDGDEPQQF